MTIASSNKVGAAAIQIIKQSTEKGQGNKDPRVVMEITTLEHPYLALEDIVVNRDTILNLEKRVKSTKKAAFPLFNHQFVAISEQDRDMISIYAVVKDVQDDSQWWSKLSPTPIVTFKSYFP